jgi:hypothetical protein
MDETTAVCMNTSTGGPTEGPTAAQETTGAAGDANSGRDTKNGGHIGRRRDTVLITVGTPQQELQGGCYKTEGLTAV